MSLPSEFFNHQMALGEKIIRMRDTNSLDSINLYNGKFFILRNEPWEPYLNHAARIANSFGIKLNIELSNYDDSLLSFPKISDNPVIIWINWNRILNIQEYFNELGTFSNFKNSIYLVPPSSFSSKYAEIKKQISKNLSWLKLIEINEQNEIYQNSELGYSKNQILEISSFIGQNLTPSLFYPEIKAIISDLDNTLYSGVLGEDLIGNLKTAPSHLELQDKLKELYSRGILLNIVSKNNEVETNSLFESNTVLTIPKQTFTCIVASWKDKSTGVQQILSELNIDEESVVMLDDNPRELAEIGSVFPRMLLINATNTNNLNRILELSIFSKKESILISSDQRSLDIKANTHRRIQTDSVIDNDAVLNRIKTVISTKVAELKSELERSEELFQKTNQFNFSNRRSKLNDPERMSHAKLLVSSVADVYSDSGLISALMYKKIPENVIIISEFVISCRALGRGIEKYIFKSMLDVMKDIGDFDSKTEIRAEFLSTSRNIPASDFLIEWFSESNSVGTYKLNEVFLRQVSNSFGRP